MKPVLRYLAVGALTNLFWYGVYLLGTLLGVLPLVMATLAYVLAVATSYIANRNWSFASNRPHLDAGPRYVAAYGLGYFNQMAWLYALTYVANIPHQVSQLIAAGITALLIFAILRFWVFTSNHGNGRRPP